MTTLMLALMTLVNAPIHMDSTRYLAEKAESDRVIIQETFVRDPMALAVADCESGARRSDGRAIRRSYSITAENPISSASGKYQFIKSTWEMVTGLPAPASAYPEHVQDAAFRKLWDGGKGKSHWAPSRHCWSR